MPRKRLATVEEAIMIHLLEYQRYFEEGTVPLEMTQAGISNAVGVRRSHISSSLDTAKAKGFIEENLAHVKGQARRRKCYTLTSMGLPAVKDLKTKFEETDVTGRLSEGEGYQGSLGHLVERTDSSMTLARLSLLTYDGTVNLPVTEPKGPGTGGKVIPEIPNFVGRVKEIEELDNLKEGSTSLIVIRGIPGIGKTALVAHTLRMWNTESRTFWFGIGEWSSPRNTANHLASNLGSRGSSRLKRYLDAHEVPDLADIGDILLGLDEPLLLVFDDCQNCSMNMSHFLKMLVSVCGSSDNVSMILIGREVPDILNLEQKLGQGTVSEMELGVLPIQASLDLLQKRGIIEPKASVIAETSGGHPLYLSLVEETDTTGQSPDASTLVSKEVFSSLKENEKEMLHCLAVFREPVDMDAFVTDDEDLDSLEKLEKRCILTRANGWVMHNLLREFFFSRQTKNDRLARHENAAEYYNTHSTGMASKVEETHHLLMAGDFESAMLLLIANGLDWLHHGFQDEILQLTVKVPGEWQNPDEVYEVQMLEACAHDQVGSWDEAEKGYGRCLKLAQSLDDSEKVARTMRRLGKIHYRRGELSEALGTFQKALDTAGSEVTGLIAEIHNSIGVVHWRQGDAGKARAAYEIDLNISEKARDPEGQSRALNNLGILDWQEGNHDIALERYARALDLAENIPDKKLVAVLYSNIADAYKSKSETDDAGKYYLRCLELSEDLRFNWQVAEAHRGLADIDVENKTKHLETALQIFDRLGAKEDAKIVKAMME